MGVFQQLFLLFKKNFILRKRQPVTLVLEVLWPLLIIAVVAVIRQGVPPSKSDTCHYQKRAMPSAGVVPFLQTFVCNLDNQCHSPYTLNQAQETTYSVSKLVQQLAPSLASDDVLQGLIAMDQGVSVMDALVNMANDTELLSGLDSFLTVRSFFDDPNYVKEVLVSKFRVLNDEQAEALLDSTVNITVIFDIIGYPDFRGVACNPARLSKFLLFKPSVDVRNISASICRISTDRISEISRFLQSHFDIAELVRIVGRFEKLKQRLGMPYTSSQAFGDIADMLDLALKSPALQSTLASLSSLRQLPDLIRRLPNMIDKIEKIGYVDMAPFVRLVGILDPVVETLKPNDTIWYTVKYTVLVAADLSDLIQRKTNGSASDTINRLLGSAQKMLESVQQLAGAMELDLKLFIGAMTQVDWLNIYDQIMTGAVNTKATEENLQKLQETLQSQPFIWNVTAPVVMVMNRILDIGTIMFQETKNLETAVSNMVNKIGPAQSALTTLFNKGPNVTLAVLSAFTDSKALAKLFEYPFSYQSFCNGIMDDVAKTTDAAVVADLRAIMCTANISTSVNNLFVSLRAQDIQSIMEDTVMHIKNLMDGKVPPANITRVFLRAQDMATAVMNFVDITNATWRNIFSTFNLPNIDLSERQWEPVLDQMNQNYVASAFLAMFRGFGTAMGNGNVGPMMGQYVHMADIVVKYSYNYLQSYVDIYSPTSTIGRMVQMMTTYAPELLKAMSSLSKNPQQIIQIVSNPDPMAAMCSWVQQMPLPSYVPHTELSNMICYELPDVSNQVMGMPSASEVMIQQIMNATQPQPGRTYDMTKDWSELLDYTERSVNMLSQPGNLLTLVDGPLSLLMVANLSRMEEVATVMGDIMKGFTYKEMASFMDISFAVMHQLEPSMQNSNDWKMVKHVLLAYNALMKASNHYYSNINATNSYSDILKMFPAEFQAFARKMASLTPDLIEALKNTIINPEKLVRKIFALQAGYGGPDCSTSWLTDFMDIDSNSSLVEFEQLACSFNWTAFGMRLLQQNPSMQEYMNQVSILSNPDLSSLPEVTVNWTELMVNTEHYLHWISGGLVMDPTKEFNLSPFNVSAIDMKWTEFVAAMENLQNVDMQRLGDLITMIQMSLEKLSLTMGPNSTQGHAEALILNSMYGQLYINHHILAFMNKILTYMSTHSTVNFYDYLGSEELKKSSRMTELAPEFSELVLDSLVSYFAEPQKFTNFLNMPDFWGQLCSNVTVFTSVFDMSKSSSDPSTLQTVLCSAGNLNYTVVYEQLRQNWDGFAEFADALIAISQDAVLAEQLRVNVSTLISDQLTYTNLLNRTIMNPPNIVFYTNNNWMNATIYAELGETFLQDMNALFSRFQDPRYIAETQTRMFEMVFASLADIPEARVAMKYMEVISENMLRQIQRTSEPLNETLQEFPNMLKILQLMNDLPFVLEVTLYTNLITPEKTARWSSAMQSFEMFCGTDPATLFTVPPGLAFSMTPFLRTMCSINITAIMEESQRYSGSDAVTALISGNMTEPANMTALRVTITQIIEALTNGNTTSGMAQGLPRLFDEALWTAVIHRMNGYLNQSSANMSPKSIFLLAQNIVASVPGLRSQLKPMEIVMIVVETILDRVLILENATSFAPRDIFPQSPQLQAMIDLMQEPGVLVVLMESLNSQKMTPLFAMANVTEVFMTLCWPGADISQYLLVPPGVTFDVSALQKGFCAINVTQLEPEVYAAFDIPRIERVVNGSEQVDWLEVGDKFQRVLDQVTRWVQMPPTVIVPPVWENETYWLNMLEQYSKARQDPAAIQAEIENLLARMGPLLMEEPFRQYGIVLKAVMRLLNENMIGLQNKSLTLTSMFSQVPILRDVITAIGLNGDMLDTLMKAPVKDTERFTRALIDPVSSNVCTSPMVWRDILDLPSTFDFSALTQAICNLNTSTMIANLVRNLDLESVIEGLNNMSVSPDWKGIMAQSQQLSQNIENLIQNPPSFNVSATLDLLEREYNQSNLWNMVTVYSALARVFGNTSEFQAVEGYMNGASLVLNFLNDLFQKMSVNGMTLDLGSLFSGSPTFTGLVNAMLHLKPDPLTALVSIQLKNSQSMAFSAFVSDPQGLASLFCDETVFLRYFNVVPGFNLSSLLPQLCGLNFTNMAQELDSNFMVSALIAKFQQMGSQPFNMTSYMAVYQQLNDKIMELVGIRNFTFGDYDLERLSQVNMTALLQASEQQSAAVMRDYPAYINTVFDTLRQSLGNTSDWKTMAVSLKILDMYLKHFNKDLKTITGQPLSLELLVRNTELGRVLLPIMSDPSWLDQILQLQIKPDKLQELLQSPDPETALCSSALWDAFVTPSNISALEYLQQQMCSINVTVLMWQSITSSAQGYQFYQQMTLLISETERGMATVNTTELTSDLTDTINLLTAYVNSLMNSSLSADNFVNVAGFQNVLSKFQSSIGQILTQMSSQLSATVNTLIWPTIPDRDAANSMARFINTMKVIMDVINNKLDDIKGGNISLDTLSGKSPALLALMEAYINVTKFGLQAWMDGQIDMQKIIELMSDQSVVTSRCRDGSVAAFISNSTTPPMVVRNLQTVLCTYMTELPQELNNLVDYQQLQQQITDIWNATGEVTPDFTGYTASVERFSQLVTQIAQANIQVSQGVKNMFEFSSLLNSLNNLVKDPSLIFTLLKPLGMVLEKPLQDDIAKGILSGIDSYMLIPISHYLQILKDNGLSFTSMLTDPMKLIKAMGVMANFDTQLSLSIETVVKPMFKSISKNTGFISNVLCNTTLVESYVLPLINPGIANILCQDPASMWVPKLRQLGLGDVEIYGLSGKLSSLQIEYSLTSNCGMNCTEDGMCMQYCESIAWTPLSNDITWIQFLSDLEKMTKLFMSESGGMTMNMTAVKAGESLEAIWNSVGKSVLGNMLETSFGVMKIVDISVSSDATWNRLKQIIHFVGTVNSYLNGMMERFTNSTSEIYLQDVFPDSNQVARLLAAVVGQDSAAEFLTASVNPVKFFSQMTNPASWVNILCDPALFRTTFTFSSGVNVGAIQTAMCTLAVNQTSSLEQLVSLFDAGKVLKELESLTSSQQSNATFGFALWDRVYNSTLRLVHNFEKLSNVRVNGTSAMAWLNPILTTLQSLQNPTMASGIATCNDLVTYLRGTDMFRYVQPIISETVFNIKMIADQMPLLSVADDFVCTLMRDANLNGAVDILKNSGFWASLTQINPTMSPSGTMDLQCSAMYQAGTKLWDVINSTLIMGNGPDWDQMGQCFVDSSKNFRSFAAGLNSAFSVATDLMTLIQDPSLRQLINTDGSLAPVLDFALRIFTEQRPILLKFSDLLKNATTVQNYLLGVLRLSPELVASLLKSSINLDAAMFLNQPVERIQATLCNATLLGEVLTLPDFVADIPTLSRLLCTNDSLSTATALKSAAEVTTIIQQALVATSTGLSQQFFNNISNHVLNLVSDLQLVTEIAGIFSNGFDVDKLRDNIPKIDRFLMSSGPERIVQSLTNILEDIQKVIPANSEARSVLKEIGIFIRGFVGLDIVQSYFLESLAVSDFLESPTVVYNYLIQLGMSPSTARTVLEGKFSINVFLNTSYILDANIPCPEMFNRLLLLNSTSRLSITQVTDDLCRINETVAVNIANMLIPQLTFGDLLQRYVTFSGDDIFKSANITAEEASDVATKLGKAQKDLIHAAALLSGKSTTMNYKSSEMLGELFKLPQAQTGANTMDSIQPLLCGKKPGDLAGDDFNVASVLGRGSKVTGNEEELSELAVADKDNGGDFCQQLYNDIHSQSLGSIIWAYLKPIMRGKILFSPDTPLTREIIGQANRVFDVLKDVKRVSKIWSEGTPNLMAMTDRAKQMGSVKEVLKNDFITSLLKQTSGLDAKELLSGIDALESGNFNSSSMKGMKVAADLLVNYTSCMELDRFVGAASEEEMEKLAFRLSDTNNFLAGVVFTNLPSDDGGRRKRATGKLPEHVQYKIRMEAENVRITNRLHPRFWEPDAYDHFTSHLQYLRGFMQLQDMIERAIIAVQIGENATLPGVYLKQFPFPCSIDDSYIGVLGSYLLPVVMTFAWLAALAIATRNLVIDREEGLEDALRIMGMKPILNWFAWLVSTLILMVIVSGILTLILKFSQLFRMSDPTIVFLYLLCFCFSSTMMVYFVSAFFTRVTLAILMVLITYFLSYLPYILLVSLEVSMKFWQKSIACLLSTSAFGFAAQYLSRLEMQNIGLQWDNIASSPVADDPMTFSWACYMMLIDSAIYLILGWYVRTVMPGKFGTSQPWYFPVSPSYWCGRKHKGTSGLSSRAGSQNVTLFESGSGGSGIPGMAVRNLTKKYGKKVTVDNISADFYEGQVTALLGHNGAAKTTTMKMLIGILEPTSGEVFINQKGSAGTIGFCPQHNTLLDYMTVQEHMELYSGIKCDWSSSDRAREIKSLLLDVDIYHVRYVRVSQLSGGMKRRLCVALAFVGGSTAVVLDEPTSGVDPHARKHIWNLITKQRLERTILLSTHHLDEADTVGDTIAIMHEGHVLCCGSPMFLKSKLGGGYHLTVEKAAKMEATGTYDGNQSDCNSGQVLTFMKTMLPRVQLVEEYGTEMTFSLPREDSIHTPFDVFFKKLDENCGRLCISSYGISDTTLEDVFLKVTALADDDVVLDEEVLEKERLKPFRTRTVTETASDTTSESSSEETTVNMLDTGRMRYSGLSLKLQQMSALLLKRFHHYRRDWRMYLSIVLLPFLLFLTSMGFATIRPKAEAMPSLLLTPDLYGPDNYMFFKDMSFESLSDRIAETLTQKPGVGTVCMDGFDSGLPITCDLAKRNFTPRVPQSNNDGCSCENFKQVCAPGSVPSPRHIRTPTGNYLQDLLGEDISQYLLHSFDEFIEKRYGGWSYEVGPEGTDTDMAATVWFNNQGYHAMPSFFNAFSNSLLRAKLGQKAGTDPSKYGISAYNHPISLHTSKLSLDNMGQQATDAGISLVFLLAFTFISSAFMVYLVNENLNKEKQLQFISGVGPVLYWITSFLWDMILYSLTVALAVVAIAIFRLGPYWDRQNLAAVVSLLMLYGWSVIPLMYMTLKLFNSASAAYLTLFCLNMLIGILTIITIFVLIIFQTIGREIGQAFDICRYLFLIFPQFCMGQGFIDITVNHYKYLLFVRFGDDVYVEPFSFELLGWNLVAMGIQGFVFFIITVIIESRGSSGESNRIPSRLLDIPDEDDDVRNERLRIQHGQTKDDLIYVNGLSKMYQRGRKKFLAVDNLSFGVSKGECFGLLGVNGAGKTTTFRMLTGDTNPSSGNAYLNGHKISTGDPYLGQEIGYCPQEGGLDGFLSGEELLFCHAKLKGMSEQYARKVVVDLVGKLHLADYAQKAINTYSGGTKRKLSLAIAMLGEPPVLFLDEPTTGMDPATRRLVWKCIIKAGQNGQSIILTSHSMDECDSLCSRLAIMVNGRLMCLGSAQHLKTKFGDGYTVTMHIQGLSNNRFNIEQAFLSRFPGATIKVSVGGQDQHSSVIEVGIPRNSTSVSELFSILQTAQDKNHITRYSLSQTSLDTVFVNFAQDQSDSISDKDEASTSDGESGSNQSGILPGPFTNQTYMNQQYMADPQDERFSSQYSANLAHASQGISLKEGKINKAYLDEDKVFDTRL